jgi:hypothetical protein
MLPTPMLAAYTNHPKIFIPQKAPNPLKSLVRLQTSSVRAQDATALSNPGRARRSPPSAQTGV